MSIRNENFLKGFVLELTPNESVTVAPEGLARMFFDGENVLLSKNGSNFVPVSGGSPGSSNVVFGAALSGAIDGVNRTFTTAFPFAEIAVFLNGVRQVSSDYAVTGPNSIEMVLAPTGGAQPDLLTCDLVLS